MSNNGNSNGRRPGVSPRETNIFTKIAPLIHTPAAIKLLGYSSMFYPNGSPDWVDIHHQTLILDRLPEEYNGYRIVQISDLHIGTWLTIDTLQETVGIINQSQPDLIVITGDFVSYYPKEYIDDISEELSNLHAPDGIIAVLGNHDHWTDADLIRSHLENAGVEFLSNRVTTLERRQTRIHIAGIDDYFVHKDRLDLVLDQLPANEFSILLAHEPDFIEFSAPTGAFDLQISGHSHGGQILLPIVGPLYLPKYGRKYPSGLYKVNGTYLYTNRGLGTAELQVRLNCPPEITIFHLRTPAQDIQDRI